MGISITGYNANGLDVYHDEAGHGGSITWAALLAAQQPTQQTAPPFLDPRPTDWDSLTLMCPVAGCGATCVHPISGGADPDAVQELFVRAIRLFKVNGITTRTQAVAYLNDRITAKEGPERVRVKK